MGQRLFPISIAALQQTVWLNFAYQVNAGLSGGTFVLIHILFSCLLVFEMKTMNSIIFFFTYTQQKSLSTQFYKLDTMLRCITNTTKIQNSFIIPPKTSSCCSYLVLLLLLKPGNHYFHSSAFPQISHK